MEQIQGVAGAGEILKEPAPPGEAVVGKVVDPAEAERGAKMVSFPGMVVNHVENDFDPGGVQIAHHRFESVTGRPFARRWNILHPARKSRSCCSPSNFSGHIDQRFFIHVIMHRQEVRPR